MDNINKMTKKQIQSKIKLLQLKLDDFENDETWKQNAELKNLIAKYKHNVVDFTEKEKVNFNITIPITGTIKYDCDDFPYIYPNFEFDKKSTILKALINIDDYDYQDKYFREIFPDEFCRYKLLCKQNQLLGKEIQRLAKQLNIELYMLYDYINEEVYK